MNHKLLWGTLLIIAIITIGAYFNNKNKLEALDQAREEAINNEIQRPSVTVNVKHQFKDGAHTFIGNLELPTPCHKISTEVIKEENETIIDISYASTSEVCAQVITEKEFTVIFAGEIDENIIARLNGELVNLNIYDIDPKQNIYEVEIFNKG
jgi:hypothetical protein